MTGLRLSLEVLRGGGGQFRGLRLAFQNISSGPQGLSLGFLGRPGPELPLTMVVTTPRGLYEFTALHNGAGAAPIDPLVIPLLSNAVYVVHVPLAAFRPVRAGASLTAALAEATELSVRFVGDKSVCDAYGYPHPNPVPCWFGEVTSNIVTLPRRLRH